MIRITLILVMLVLQLTCLVYLRDKDRVDQEQIDQLSELNDNLEMWVQHKLPGEELKNNEKGWAGETI